MGQRHYDRNGRLVGYQQSDTEAAAKDAATFAAMGAMGVVAAIIAPFAPILWGGYQVFLFLTATEDWHELFAGVITLAIIAGSLWLLWSFKWVRIPYFGAEVVFATAYAFVFIRDRHDAIWGGFAALLVLAFGAWIIMQIERQFEKQFA